MRMLVTVVREGGESEDVVVTTDDTATAGDVAEVLTQAVGQGIDPRGVGSGNVVAMPGTSLSSLPGYGTAVAGAPASET